MLPSNLFSQVNGLVIDAESNEPIQGAVIAVNHKNIAVTDLQGRFVLDSMKSKDNVSITYLGYLDDEYAIDIHSKDIVIKLKPNPHQLSEVVVSDQVHSQKLKLLTGNYSLLSQNDLARGSGITVANYLNQVPGVFMEQGALNTNRLIIRGVGSRTPYTTNRIKAYFDEIPLTTGDGATTMEDIDITGISRIEILKGPSSALYGSGLGGVVKFYPSMLSNDQEEINYNSEAGSYGTFKNTISTSLKQHNYAVNGIYSNVYADGFRQNSRYKRNSAFIYGTRYGKKSNVKATLSLIRLNSQISSSLDENTFNNSPELAAKNWLAIKGYEDYTRMLGGVTYTSLFSKILMNQITPFMISLDHYQSRPFNILWENSIDYGVRDKFTFTQKNQTIVGGFEWFNEDYTWKIYNTSAGTKGAITSHNKENRDYLNVFALWTMNIKQKLILEAGLNWNTLTYKITDLFADNINNSGHYQYKPVVSPKLGMNYQLLNNINVYTSLGHGFSAPSLQETLLPEGQPNPNLKPEEGWNVDVGTRMNLLNNRLYLEVTQYWLFLRNLLVTKRLTEDIFTGENAGETNHRGIEILAKYSFIPNTANSAYGLDLSVSYTNSRNQFKSFIDTARDYSGKRLPGIPSNALNFNISSKILSSFQLFIDYQEIGQQYMTDDNSKKYKGYQLVGLKAVYTKAAFRNYTLGLYAGMQNLFNEHYASMILVNAPALGTTPPRYYYPGNPRSFYAGLRIGFRR